MNCGKSLYVKMFPLGRAKLALINNIVYALEFVLIVNSLSLSKWKKWPANATDQSHSYQK